jgi:Tol biopolymer transport system component
VEIGDGEDAVIWIDDLKRGGGLRRLTIGGRNRYPVWTPDGLRVTFQSDREGDYGVFWQLADGTRPAERLTRPDSPLRHIPEAWNPDDKTLTIAVVPPFDYRLFALPAGNARIVKPLLMDIPAEHSSFSPDGKWLAYASTEIGNRREVFVQPIPLTGQPYQVSSDGGTTPVWSRDGSQLYYWASLGQQFVAVDVRTQPTFAAVHRVVLSIDALFVSGRFPARNYDVMPDGQFVVVTRADPPAAEPQRSPAQQIEYVFNWADELRGRVPAK